MVAVFRSNVGKDLSWRNGNVKVAKEVAATNEIVEAKETSILNKNNIVLGLESVSKEEAIKRVGEILAKEGYVKEEYIQAMLEREEIVSTYIGMGVAIPHGVGEAKKEVKKVMLQARIDKLENDIKSIKKNNDFLYVLLLLFQDKALK